MAAIYNYEVLDNAIPAPPSAPRLVWRFPVDGRPVVERTTGDAVFGDYHQHETLVRCSYRSIGTLYVMARVPIDEDDDAPRNQTFTAAQGEVFVFATLVVGQFVGEDSDGVYDPSKYPMPGHDIDDHADRDVVNLPIPAELMTPVCQQLLRLKWTDYNVNNDILHAVQAQLVMAAQPYRFFLGCGDALHGAAPEAKGAWTAALERWLAQQSRAPRNSGIEAVRYLGNNVYMLKSMDATERLVATVDAVSVDTLGLAPGEMGARLGLDSMLAAARRAAQRIGNCPVDARVDFKQAVRTWASVWTQRIAQALADAEAADAAAAAPPPPPPPPPPEDAAEVAARAAAEARRRRAEATRAAKALEGDAPFAAAALPQLRKGKKTKASRSAEAERQHQLHIDETEKALRAMAFDERQAEAHRLAEERKANDKATREAERASEALKAKAVKEQGASSKGVATLGEFLY